VLDNLAEFGRIALVVTNLSSPEWDPDAPACNVKASFAYDLETVDLATPPTVLGIDPSKLVSGQHYDAWLSGADFQAGLSVDFGAGIAVTAVDFVDSTSVALSLDVARTRSPAHATSSSPTRTEIVDALERCQRRTSGRFQAKRRWRWQWMWVPHRSADGRHPVSAFALLALLATLVGRRRRRW
jgi:MYXO-CTERM domain-containing protein